MDRDTLLQLIKDVREVRDFVQRTKVYIYLYGVAIGALYTGLGGLFYWMLHLHAN